MKRVLVPVTVGLVVAAASCGGTPKGSVIMSSIAGNASAQSDDRSVTLRPVRIDGAREIDGLKLVDVGGRPTLLYSSQAETPNRRYELVIRAASGADFSRTTEVARIDRMLPPPPQWDARPADNGYEFVYEMAGGAVNAIIFRDVQGNTKQVSAEHPFESFTRPHFVRTGARENTSDIGAVADLKKIVVFPGGTKLPAKYETVAEGTDGIVGGTSSYRWVVSKNSMSGPSLFDTLPGRLTLLGIGVAAGVGTVVPDLLVYELDATPSPNDVLVFATGKPALLLLGRRANRPYQLAAEEQSWLLWLSQPTILVTQQSVHLAAIARRGGDDAVVLYGSVPIAALDRQ